MIKRELKTKQLETYLERAEWENDDLAKAANMAPLSLSNWISKSHRPTPRMIYRITSAINERYMQLGILMTLTREDILDEVLCENKHKTLKPRHEAIIRFWSKVHQSGRDECWNWMGKKTCGGYGSCWSGKRRIRAHRFSWEIVHGPIPDELLCLHQCDNPPCVNPNHLYIGTYSDNLRDKLERFQRPDKTEPSMFFNRYPS